MSAVQLANDFLGLASRPVSLDQATELVRAALGFRPNGARWAIVVPAHWFPVFAPLSHGEIRITIESDASAIRVVEVRP